LQTATPTDPAAAAAPAAAGDRPTYVPEAFWDAEKGLKADDFQKHLEQLEAKATAADKAREGVPEKPEGYELKLPPIEGLPEGVEIDADDPRLGILRKLAHETGMSQDKFSSIIAAQVKHDLALVQARNAELAAEKKALGPEADQRITAVQDALKGALGDKAKPLIAMLASAQAVEAFESILKGGPDFAANGRAETEPGTIPGYDKMSFVQRRAAQDALKARRAG